MESHTSCPVCKLYLLPGMSLDEHLETHPKDQVIKALVNMYSQPPIARPQPVATPVNAVATLSSPTHIYNTPSTNSHQIISAGNGTIFLNANNSSYHQQSPKYILIPQQPKSTQLALPPPPLRLNSSNNNHNFHNQQQQQQPQQHHYQQPTTQISIPTLTAASQHAPITQTSAGDVINNQQTATIQYLQETDKNVMIVNSCSTQYIQQTTIPSNNNNSSAESLTPPSSSIFPRYTNERYSGPPPPYSAAISTITQTQNHTVRSRLQQSTSVVRQPSSQKQQQYDDEEEGEIVLHEFVVSSIDGHTITDDGYDNNNHDADDSYDDNECNRSVSNLNSQDMEIDSMGYDARYTDPVEYSQQQQEQQQQLQPHLTGDEETQQQERQGEQQGDVALTKYLKDDGNFTIAEKSQIRNESMSSAQFVFEKPSQKANDNHNINSLLQSTNGKINEPVQPQKSTAKQGLKVISNIKVTEDILSEGLKDIIIRANSKSAGGNTGNDDIFIQSGSCKFPMPLIERIIKVEAKSSVHMELDDVVKNQNVDKVVPVVIVVDHDEAEEDEAPIDVDRTTEDSTAEDNMPIVIMDDDEPEIRNSSPITSATTSVIRLVSTGDVDSVPTVTVPILSAPPSPIPSTSKTIPLLFEHRPPSPVASTSTAAVVVSSNIETPLYHSVAPLSRPVFNKPPKKLFVKFKNPPPSMEEAVEIEQEPIIKKEEIECVQQANEGTVHYQDSNMDTTEDTNIDSIITLSPASTKTEIDSDDEQLIEQISVKEEPTSNEIDEVDGHSTSSSPLLAQSINTEEIFKEIQQNYPSFSKDILNERNFSQDFLKKEPSVKEEIIETEEIVDDDEADVEENDADGKAGHSGTTSVLNHHSMDENENDNVMLVQTTTTTDDLTTMTTTITRHMCEGYILPDQHIDYIPIVSKEEVHDVQEDEHHEVEEEEEESKASVHEQGAAAEFSQNSQSENSKLFNKFDLNEAGPSRGMSTSTVTTQQQQQQPMTEMAGPRETFALSNFLSYANPDPESDNYIYTNERARFSPMVYNPTSEENIQFQWCQSPQYPPFDERSSYVDLDLCSKTNSNSVSVCATTTTTTHDNNSAQTNVTTNDRAPSAHSLNIRTDEKMPAKGELSEQESNGEIDQWNQMYPISENTLPHYPSSYEMSTAQECWNLNTKCTTVSSSNHLQHNGHSLIVSNFQLINSNADHHLHHHLENNPQLSLTSGLQEIIPKLEHGLPTATATSSTEDNKKLLADKIKTRKYRCSECPEVFPLLKMRREHMVQDHGHNHHHEATLNSMLCSSKIKTESGMLSSAVASSSTVTYISQDIFSDLANTQQFIIKQIKDATTTELEEQTSVSKYKTKINRILMDYNMLNHELQLNATESSVSHSAKLAILRRNLDSLGKGTAYTCVTCRAEFPTLRLFDQHMTIHPGECYTCGRTFKHWSNFALHIKRHLGIRNYVCRACHKGFVVRQKLIEHLRTHTGAAPIKCGICNERFRRYSNLVQHRNRHHLNKRPPKADFVCHCGEVFNSKAKVEWHAEIHEAKPKGCPHCRERFIHRNSLTRHIRLSHPEKYDFVKKDTHTCPVCFKKFVASSIKTHLETHSSSKKLYSCNICNKNFSTKWNLKQHQYTHANRSSKPFLCTLCPNAFIRETDFVTHMNAHRSIRPYCCNFCGRQFVRKYNWLRHTREHEKEKKFTCLTCGKKFHRQYYLTEHKRVHSGERPFSCNICGKTSATKTNHNKHVKIHHARDPLTAEG